MCPEIVKIGPFTVYSYGLMLGIAFLIASYLLSKEVIRKGLPQNISTEVTLLAIVFGIIGGKALHLIENFNRFLDDPVGSAFSPGGLTFYGGLILSIIVIWIYVRKKKIPFLFIADAAAPSLAIAYGIGRIGCHLSGDGDYGIPTDLPWGVNYSNGTVPPSAAFSDPALFQQFPWLQEKFPDGIVPDNTPLHPTPIYEFLSGLIIFAVLWKFRKKSWVDGKLFMLYLILSGVSRLLVEFIRLNPRILLGLSEAQIISVVLIIIGIGGFIILTKKNKPVFVPPPVKAESGQKK